MPKHFRNGLYRYTIGQGNGSGKSMSCQMEGQVLFNTVYQLL
jgi:hypothetical protein